MAIAECPACNGEGYITEEGRHPVSYYIAEGWMIRADTLKGTRLVPTQRFLEHAEEFPLEDGVASFVECWCNHEIIFASRMAGVPLYWENDQGGNSQRIVARVWSEAVPDGHSQAPLTKEDIAFLRAYCAQWVIGVNKANAAKGSPVLPSDQWLPQVARAETAEDFMALDEMLAEYGLDPF